MSSKTERSIAIASSDFTGLAVMNLCFFFCAFHGNVRFNLRYTCWSHYAPFTGYWRVNITLQKILPNGTRVLLAVMYSFDKGAHGVNNRALIFPISTPITINAGERLAVVFLIEYKWWAAGGNSEIAHYFDPTTDDFLINIPIVP